MGNKETKPQESSQPNIQKNQVIEQTIANNVKNNQLPYNNNFNNNPNQNFNLNQNQNNQFKPNQFNLAKSQIINNNNYSAQKNLQIIHVDATKPVYNRNQDLYQSRLSKNKIKAQQPVQGKRQQNQIQRNCFGLPLWIFAIILLIFLIGVIVGIVFLYKGYKTQAVQSPVVNNANTQAAVVDNPNDNNTKPHCETGYFYYKNKCLKCPDAGTQWNGKKCVTAVHLRLKQHLKQNNL